ncbi:hypothetical protein KJ854_04490 [Patescibacteria group bacterium]|nr:hypothetical protein [Patescibacteria group bacterium]
MATAKQKFENILSEASADSNIVGFFLGGSRGKGTGNEFSGWEGKDKRAINLKL